ncbi:MAG TPA: YhcH/YjgK/YiaL family protein [Agriterribacter sp.]|nr:YhcH/YjgK/YiaL family protein [Agriterribacter sp.]HRQ50119.1 YhcH/YjgK/YiaL family protein [Agriterribacter sp.]
MIIDNLSAAEKYYKLHPLFGKAFGYLRSLDLQHTEEGKHELPEENLFYILMDKQGLTKEAAIENFECHNKYIDIQLCIHGKETIGWKSRDTCTRQKDSNEQEDYCFYGEPPDIYFQLRDNQFAIFFPGDVHAPMIGEGKIRKVVVKVKAQV